MRCGGSGKVIAAGVGVIAPEARICDTSLKPHPNRDAVGRSVMLNSLHRSVFAEDAIFGEEKLLERKVEWRHELIVVANSGDVALDALKAARLAVRVHEACSRHPGHADNEFL
jgi:hypothetical protein